MFPVLSPDRSPARLGPEPAVEISAQPSAEWLELWWSVDGRGGADELAVARGILEGCPSLYALVRDDGGAPAAVARLALPNAGPSGPGWGGLYCMATRPDARRRGYGGRVVRALLHEGGARGLAGYWLLVMASNAGARGLYAGAGFREAGRLPLPSGQAQAAFDRLLRIPAPPFRSLRCRGMSLGSMLTLEDSLCRYFCRCLLR